MKVLVLDPGRHALDSAFFTSGQGGPVHVAHDSGQGEAKTELKALMPLLHKTLASARKVCPDAPEAIGIRVAFGGSEFTGPTLVDGRVTRSLKALGPQAPLHVPAVVTLLQGCREVLPDTPVVLVFETAFFTRLPAREYLYGLNRETSRSLSLRRRGFHGIYHEAACEHMRYERRRSGQCPPARILSICLDPHPEIAAVAAGRPLLTTGGATPLEGIPGHTTCGDLDPSIVLMLAQRKQWGPEQINAMLTRDSGLLGMTGKTATLAEVLGSTDDHMQLARQVIEYRILLACGAGIAAMGGLDGIVFSGRFAAAGAALGPLLASRLAFKGGLGERGVPWMCFPESLHRLIADQTAAVILKEHGGQPDEALEERLAS